MTMPRRIAPILSSFFLALALSARGQGFSPEEAVKRMTLPDGLRARLVACEPMIVQPVAIEFDDRGRLWVVQYLQYPNPAGLKRVKVDRYSRTTYDRVPEPPPRGPKGADRVTILEDEDGDGRADRAHDFVSGLSLASGLAFGYGGVFILQPPYLLFYPDRNGDDTPDTDPDVLLTGFGMEDAHAVANSLLWGPDGWLYGTQGSTVTAKINGIEFQQGIWRYHPITKRFELFCEGGGNMWGLDYDARGNLFASTNFGPYVMLHAEQGAYYWKSFAKHGELHNPYAYGYFDHATHRGAQGGHVTDGGIVYQGDALPERFRGMYLANNLLSHAVYWHRIHSNGWTFETEHGGVLLESNDDWFAPSDLTTGPDGCVYVADWHDKRTAHPDPDADWDRSNGRIYRIEPSEGREAPKVDLQKATSAELLKLLSSPNNWLVRRARRILGERPEQEINGFELLRPKRLDDPKIALFLLLKQRAVDASQPSTALEALWAMNVLAKDGQLVEAALHGLFDEDRTRVNAFTTSDADLWRWRVRLIGDRERVKHDERDSFYGLSKGPSSIIGEENLMQLAERETNPAVRGQLACAAKRLPANVGLSIIYRLLANPTEADDQRLGLLMWWAVERHALEILPTLRLIAGKNGWKSRLGRKELLPRLMRRYASDASAEGDRACITMLSMAKENDAENEMIAALNQGLADRGQGPSGAAMGNLYEQYAVAGEPKPAAPAKRAEISAELKSAIDKLWEESKSDPDRIRAAARAGNAAAIEHAVAIAADGEAAPEARRAMIEIVGEAGGAEAARTLLLLALSPLPDDLRGAALDALRRFSDPAIPGKLVAAYGELPASLRPRARSLLLGRAESSRALLLAVDAGTIKPDEIPIAELRGVALHDNAELNALVAKHWGVIKEGTPEEKLADMRRLNNDLRAAKGDPAKGRETFKKLCAACHTLHGEGGKIGPDLTQANRKDTDFLLSSLVDPSLSVRKEYLQSIIETRDGRVLNGIVTERTAGTVTLADAKGEKAVIQASEIKEERESTLSLMPEDLLRELKPDALRDLFSHLQSEAPAAPGK